MEVGERGELQFRDFQRDDVVSTPTPKRKSKVMDVEAWNLCGRWNSVYSSQREVQPGERIPVVANAEPCQLFIGSGVALLVRQLMEGHRWLDQNIQKVAEGLDRCHQPPPRAAGGTRACVVACRRQSRADTGPRCVHCRSGTGEVSTERADVERAVADAVGGTHLR